MIQQIVFMTNQSRFFFYHFPKYHWKILLGDFNAKLRRKDFSNQQLGMRVSIRIGIMLVLE